MAVRIRLRRTGKRNAPCHRIVVTDSRSPRDGRFIENIGVYDPRAKYEKLDLERADYWLSVGAIPSETVGAIIQRARAGIVRDGATTAHHRTEAAIPTAPEPEAKTEAETPAADTETPTEKEDTSAE